MTRACLFVLVLASVASSVFAVAAEPPKVDCEGLLSEVLEQAPIRLSNVDPGTIDSLSPIDRQPGWKIWSLANTTSPQQLKTKLRYLFDHIVQLSFVANDQERLYDDEQIQRYLDIQKNNMDLFVDAWTNPETLRVEFRNPELLKRPEVLELQKQQEANERLLGENISFLHSTSFAAQRVIPQFTIGKVTTKWSVSLEAHGDEGIQAIVIADNNGTLEKFHQTTHEERMLAAYGSLGRLFGDAPLSLPGLHRHEFFNKEQGIQVTLGALAEALSRLSVEGGGQFNKRAFLQTFATTISYQMLYIFCRSAAGMCAKIHPQVHDIVEQYDPALAARMLMDSDGTYYATGANMLALQSMFSHFVKEEYFSGNSDEYRYPKWDDLKKFSQTYFVGIDDATWDSIKGQFVEAYYSKAGSNKLLAQANVTGNDAISLLMGRVVVSDLTVQYFLDYSDDHMGSLISDERLVMFTMGMQSTAAALMSRDLTETQIKILYHRLRELLCLPQI